MDGFKMRPIDWIVLIIFLIAFFFFVGVVMTSAAEPTVISTPSDYPKSYLTPGVTRTVDMKTLCTAGSTRDARHVTPAMKKQVFQRYGYIEGKYKPGDYEIDHFISLENGGANDIKNLWPQKYCPIGNDPLKTKCWGAREKDKVETALHRWLCQGNITLTQDQQILRHDWIHCYMEIVAGHICTALP